VLNRANGRLRLFKKEADFAAFEPVLTEAYARVPLRVLGWVLVGNHWVLMGNQRGADGQSLALRRLAAMGPGNSGRRFLPLAHRHALAALTRPSRYAHHGTLTTARPAHVYQGRFKSFPIAADEHLLSVLRYVEQNPVRASVPRTGAGPARVPESRCA
jgi:putative transposase